MIPILLLALNLTRIDTAPIPACIDPQGFYIPCSDSVLLERIADAFAVDLVFLGAGVSGDLLSTAAFRHYCPTRCREGNALVFSPDALVPLKLGSATAVGGAQYLLRRKGKGKLATALRWTYLAVNVGLTINNTRLAIQGE